MHNLMVEVTAMQLYMYLLFCAFLLHLLFHLAKPRQASLQSRVAR